MFCMLHSGVSELVRSRFLWPRNVILDMLRGFRLSTGSRVANVCQNLRRRIGNYPRGRCIICEWCEDQVVHQPKYFVESQREEKKISGRR